VTLQKAPPLLVRVRGRDGQPGVGPRIILRRVKKRFFNSLSAPAAARPAARPACTTGRITY
jgi:hypothetical protein